MSDKVRQLLINIIAECLVLFPPEVDGEGNLISGIPRINRIASRYHISSGDAQFRQSERVGRLASLAPNETGLFGHIDICSGNALCPGVDIWDWQVINEAIILAKAFDGK